MHAASSVSELYAADEVDLLLDEIRHLEPTSCRPEELQDLEIAGSGCAGWDGAGAGWDGASGGTERSWDSHAGYRRAGRAAARALAPLYCGWRRALSARALAGAGAAAAGGAAAALALAGAGRGAPALGALGALGGRARALQAAAVCAALLHGSLVFAHVSRLADLLPIRWHLLTALCSAWCCVSQLWAGAALLAGLGGLGGLGGPAGLAAAADPPRPLLTAAAGLCICGSVFSLALLGLSARGLRAGGAGAAGGAGGPPALYRAVPPRPPDPRDTP